MPNTDFSIMHRIDSQHDDDRQLRVITTASSSSPPSDLSLYMPFLFSLGFKNDSLRKWDPRFVDVAVSLSSIDDDDDADVDDGDEVAIAATCEQCLLNVTPPVEGCSNSS